MTGVMYGKTGTTVLAAVGDTTGIQSWLGKNILPVLISIIALTMMVHSRKKKNRDIIEMSLGAIIALTWFAVATMPGKAEQVGSFVATMVFGG